MVVREAHPTEMLLSCDNPLAEYSATLTRAFLATSRHALRFGHISPIFC
jgi:hypothetical protein